MYTTLQHDVPLFVRDFHRPLKVSNKVFKYNQHFPWQEMGIPVHVVEALWSASRVYHNPDLEEKIDGYVDPTILTDENLKNLYDVVNKKVREDTPSEATFKARKIKFSKIRHKQIALKRSWRRANDRWEDLVKLYDEELLRLYESQGTKAEVE